MLGTNGRGTLAEGTLVEGTLEDGTLAEDTGREHSRREHSRRERSWREHSAREHWIGVVVAGVVVGSPADGVVVEDGGRSGLLGGRGVARRRRSRLGVADPVITISPLPMALTATIPNEYETPLVSPATVQDVPLLDPAAGHVPRASTVEDADLISRGRRTTVGGR